MKKVHIFTGNKNRKYLASWVKYLCLSLITLALCLTTQPLLAQNTTSSPQLFQQGQTYYMSGDFQRAATVWQEAAQNYQTQGDRLNQAKALSNLTLAYQQLGRWTEANEIINTSLSLISESPDSPEKFRARAQALNTQGSLLAEQGKLDEAAIALAKAAADYQQVGDATGLTRNQLNAARVFQLQGQIQKAAEILKLNIETLQAQPNSALKVAALRQAGEILRLVGSLEEARKPLEQSLEIAKTLGLQEEQSKILLALGDLSRVEFDKEQEALNFYQNAATTAVSPTTEIQALVQQFSLLISTQQIDEANSLIPTIQTKLATLPLSREVVYGRINLAKNLVKLERKEEAAKLLAIAYQQAEELGNKRAASYALGTLGGIYEKNKQWSESQQASQNAILLAQSQKASDITYQWQWQLGRSLKAQGKTQEAIDAYEQAYRTLQSIRSDLITLNSEIGFSFREGVEPVYREFVELLLESPDQKDIERARDVIESLQVAELVNFFRADCELSRLTTIENVDRNAAVIYPIVLPDRLEIIFSLPNQPLRHYRVNGVDKLTIEDFATGFRYKLDNPESKDYLFEAQQLYKWLIDPIAADLEQSGVQNLVFVLDGVLRNIPMSVLHDGQQYLIQKYAIALTPGLQLLAPQPLSEGSLKVLIGALSKAVNVEGINFQALPGVEEEIKVIQADVPGSEILKNESFTNVAFAQKIKNSSFPVVHIATHGQFGSTAQDTYIVTYDQPINANQLSELLRNSSGSTRNAIELLIFSACETASGDARAALGLAGIAVRSGARSTIATLWQVNDESTAEFMDVLYERLSQSNITKAEALRQAQKTLLEKPEFQHPFYWSPFVLIGNWL